MIVAATPCTCSSMQDDTANQAALVDLTAVSFRASTHVLLDEISLSLGPGDFLAILGGNGAGKTTLLSMIDATSRPSAGAVSLFGNNPWRLSERDRSRLRARIGVVPQRADFNELIPLTMREVVALGRLRGRAFSSRLLREDEQAIDESMELLGIQHLAGRVYQTLSGGEQQKAQLARALAQHPALLLLDEPTSGLDLRWQEQLTGIIERLSQTLRLPIVMTTHILSHLPSCCNRAALLRGGRILFDGPIAEALTSARLSELYECPVEIVERGGRRYCIGLREKMP